MQLTPEQVAKFQAIYKAKFGYEINSEQAYEQGIKLIRLVQIIYKPMTQSELALIIKRQNRLNN